MCMELLKLQFRNRRFDEVNLRSKQYLLANRGIQYACTEFTSLVGKNITRSMSGKGNCYDNAVAESFFKTLKTELVYQNKYETRKHAKNSVFE